MLIKTLALAALSAAAIGAPAMAQDYGWVHGGYGPPVAVRAPFGYGYRAVGPVFAPRRAFFAYGPRPWGFYGYHRHAWGRYGYRGF
jgi:hypothetical protein